MVATQRARLSSYNMRGMAKQLVSVRDARDRAIAVLSDLFARDELELDEFERRVNLVHRAPSPAEVDKVIADLPVPVAEPQHAPQTALVPVSDVRDSQTIVAVMGGAERKGTWSSARRLRVWTVMGGATLDFREARLPPGVTEISIFSLMGGVEIIVPPELPVETNGIAIMGGFEHLERTPGDLEPDRPTLRVHGFVMMGGFSVETRLVGESSSEARRRRKREGRERRKLLEGKR